ncbi:MAG: hypothetical protein EOP29_24940 [Rhodococcus sp. (in: high G+C Gram-positive bacteria)]|nr:MAG: hypothetical protein EOP29_24940 [Rhodococcus sp. (in: high G+C Gram-positive bacteria)]
MNLERLSKPQRVAAVSMLVVVLGSFLPWVSVFGISVSGIRGDGAITLLLALAGLALLAVTAGVFGPAKDLGKAGAIAMIVLAGITVLIGLVDMSGMAAIGLYLTLFAGIGWLVGAIWDVVEVNNATTEGGSGH